MYKIEEINFEDFEREVNEWDIIIKKCVNFTY